MLGTFLLLTQLVVASEAGAATVPADLGGDVSEEVLVTGEQPGPALWKVSSGDHALWLLGEVSPLPAKVKWRSKQFEAALSQSQEVLLEQGEVMEGTKQQSAQMVRLRTLPEGQMLKDIVSPELYARTKAVTKLFRTPERLDKLRPFFAANRVVMSAINSMDLKAFSVRFTVMKRARDAKVKITVIPTPQQTFADFLQKLEFGSTVPCLEQVVDIVEDGGSGLRRVANAWSIGDIDGLRELVPKYAMLNESREAGPCTAAYYGGAQRANEYLARRAESWASAAERALAENAGTIAVVPIAQLLEAGGYLDALRAKGYEIEEPK